MFEVPSRVSLQAAVALAVSGADCAPERLRHQLGIDREHADRLAQILVDLGLAVPVTEPPDTQEAGPPSHPFLAGMVWSDRPVSRIPELLSLLNRYWLRHPQLRLGQLLINLVRPEDPCSEMYNVEDQVVTNVLTQRLAAGAKDPRRGA